MLFSEFAVLPARQRSLPRAAVPRFPDPGFRVFLFRLCGCFCVGALGPKWGPRRPRHPKRCQKGAQKLIFRSPKRDFWGATWREWPLAKTSIFNMFNNIIQASAPAFSHVKSIRERNVHQRRSFSLFYAHFGRQSGAQGRPKGAQRAQKEPQTPPPGHLKITKKLTWDPTQAKREPGRLQGCPWEGK